MAIPVISDVEKILFEGNACKFISQMYTLLLNNSPKPGLYKSRMRWESGLNIMIDKHTWPDFCRDSMSATINARYRLTHYNFLHQLYVTPLKIHKSKSELSDTYFRCSIEVSSFLHCTWLCNKVRPFWHDLCDTLTRITGVILPLDPELCLLGNWKH